MTFTLTEQQEMLRATLREYLAERHDPLSKETHGAAQGPGSTLWQGLAEDLGLLGLSFPEDQGGLGLGAIETMIVMEELGRALVNQPFLDGAIVAAKLLGHRTSDDVSGLISGIVAGKTLISFAHTEAASRNNPADVQLSATADANGRYVLNGKKAVVAGAPKANWFIVSARSNGARRDRDGISLFLVEAGAQGISRRDYRTLDGVAASDLVFDNVMVEQGQVIGAPGKALPVIEEVLDVAAAAICAEASGVMRKLVDDTLEYTKNRRQGGKALADHQVIQHRIVDMALQTEQASALAQAAALKLSSSPEERAMAVSAAKAFASKAVKFVGQSAVQLHGGMGMTDEIAIGNLFRRGTMIEKQLGSADYHLHRWEALSLPSAAAA